MIERKGKLFAPIYLVDKRVKIDDSGIPKTYCQLNRTVYMAEMSRNLDRLHNYDGKYFCRNPKTNNPIHCGISTLRSGVFVFTKEEIFPDKPRSQSWRFSYVITDDEATDLILLSNNLDLLNKGRFKSLGKKLLCNPDWQPVLTIESAYWSQAEKREIKRRLQYVYE